MKVRQHQFTKLSVTDPNNSEERRSLVYMTTKMLIYDVLHSDLGKLRDLVACHGQVARYTDF